MQIEELPTFRLFSVGGWGTRHTFTLLSFLGMANVYAMRVNLSVAIVAMVKHGDSSTTPSSWIIHMNI